MKRIVSIFIILIFAGQSWAAVGLNASSGLFQVASAEKGPGLEYSMEKGIRDGEIGRREKTKRRDGCRWNRLWSIGRAYLHWHPLGP